MSKKPFRHLRSKCTVSAARSSPPVRHRKRPGKKNLSKNSRNHRRLLGCAISEAIENWHTSNWGYRMLAACAEPGAAPSVGNRSRSTQAALDKYGVALTSSSAVQAAGRTSAALSLPIMGENSRRGLSHYRRRARLLPLTRGKYAYDSATREWLPPRKDVYPSAAALFPLPTTPEAFAITA